MDFYFKHPESGETKVLTLSEKQLADMIDSDALLDKMMESECNCQPVGETNVVECNCDEYLGEFELQENGPFEGIEIPLGDVELVNVKNGGVA